MQRHSQIIEGVDAGPGVGPTAAPHTQDPLALSPPEQHHKEILEQSHPPPPHLPPPPKHEHRLPPPPKLQHHLPPPLPLRQQLQSTQAWQQLRLQGCS